jgi:hypothetical protein
VCALVFVHLSFYLYVISEDRRRLPCKAWRIFVTLASKNSPSIQTYRILPASPHKGNQQNSLPYHHVLFLHVVLNFSVELCNLYCLVSSFQCPFLWNALVFWHKAVVLTPELFSVLWIYHNGFKHIHIDSYVGCFKFLVMIKNSVLIFYVLMFWSKKCPHL